MLKLMHMGGLLYAPTVSFEINAVWPTRQLFNVTEYLC